MVSQLIPEASDYIVLKPKHSAFYATPLDTLFFIPDSENRDSGGLNYQCMHFVHRQ